MNLRLKINLTSLVILLTVTTALATVGVLAITKISYDLNRRLMIQEVENLRGSINTAIGILEQSGVATVASYQQRAHQDVLQEFNQYTFGESGELIVVNKADGSPLTHAPAESIDQEFLANLTKQDTGCLTHKYAGQSRFFCYATHDDWDWLLVLSERTATMLELRKRFIYFVVLITLVGFVLGGLLLLWSTNKIVGPIRQLAKAADGISHGDYQTELPPTQGADEIAGLTDSFKQMADHLQITYHDLHENLEKVQQSQDELYAEKERLSVTLSSIGDGVISTDPQGRITLVNNVAATLTGWSLTEAIGQPLENVFCLTLPDKSGAKKDPLLPRILKKEKAFGSQHTLFTKTGEQKIVAASGAPIHDNMGTMLGVILVFRDITESLKMQKESLKSQKLESVGVLAGGIAHDFNNILTGILGNLSLAKHVAPQEDALFSRLDNAEKATLRARDLTRQLLTFSKGGEPVKELVNLSKIVQETASFALTGSNCRCEYHLADNLLPVNADTGQISQVIHNLVINGCQSMADGGTIVIGMENHRLRGNDSLLLGVENFIKIIIKDSGCGISKDHISKVFDPYFSTKDGGNGLGLASAYSIITKHSGIIDVESKPGKGSTFTILLPAQKEQIASADELPEQVQKGSGRVLVLDDESVVREVVEDMLTNLGYMTDHAPDGETAIEKYQKALSSNQRYDFVIMDLTIPGGMGGKEAIAVLRELDPGIIAIVISGYANDPVMANYKQHGFSAILTKPFTLKQLSAVLGELGNKSHTLPS